MDGLHTNILMLALEKSLLSEAQFSDCLTAFSGNATDKQLEEYLLDNRYLSSEQLDSLLKKRKINLKKLETQAIMDYVVKMKMVSAQELDETLELQRKAGEQKTYIPLSQLLVSRGAISNQRMEEVLQSKEVQRFIRQAVCADDPRRTGLIGRVLGGYELISEIASGGMGTVYLALQLELDRKVAFKILFEQFASQAKHLQQFFREAKLSAILNHPNLVHIFEVGNDQGFYYYSMELVEGTNIGDRLKEEQKFSQEECLDMITQAGRGLEHIHSYDIVHRDIKPSNFIIRHDGIVKIMDLGLARQMNQVQKKASTMGTPYYMAPELIQNPEEANHRADIYALGVSFYKMLTGDYPITGNDAKEILKNITDQIPKPVQQLIPEASPDMCRIIHKMIEKDVNKRYQNMTAVLADLDRVLIM